MKKGELQDHHDQLAALGATIRTMANVGRFPEVFAVCEESFPHLVPAIKHRKQNGLVPETPGWLGLDVICKYAPPLFEHAVIESLVAFIQSTRVLARHENAYLETAEAAFGLEETARILWNHLEGQPGTLDVDVCNIWGLPRDTSRLILDVWAQLGVVLKKANRLYLRSTFGEETEGLCPACGAHGKGRKEAFFKISPCKNCGVTGHYHIRYADTQ